MVLLCISAPALAAPPGESAEAARLLRRWAPTFVQHVAPGDAGRDRPTRVDFDGDWDPRNNAARQLERGPRLPPAVYGAAVTTDTHAFLTYTLYYPRDWAEPVCAPYLCHDGDFENLRLVIDLRPGDPDGRLALAESQVHLGFFRVDGDDVARTADGRPLARVEARGHGVRACRRGDPACAPRPSRILYARGDAATAPPRRARGQRVRYELLPLAETLWPRRALGAGSPWTAGQTGPLRYHGERLGRLGHPLGAALAGGRPGGASVRPPWAVRGPGGVRGDWFFDPAGAFSPTSDAPAEYVHHPFLADLRDECRGLRCAPAVRVAEAARSWTWTAFGGLAFAMALAMGREKTRLRRHARSWRWRGHRHRPSSAAEPDRARD